MLMHELNRTHLGQGMDIHWHNQQSVDITEDQYKEYRRCRDRKDDAYVAVNQFVDAFIHCRRTAELPFAESEPAYLLFDVVYDRLVITSNKGICCRVNVHQAGNVRYADKAGNAGRPPVVRHELDRVLAVGEIDDDRRGAEPILVGNPGLQYA